MSNDAAGFTLCCPQLLVRSLTCECAAHFLGGKLDLHDVANEYLSREHGEGAYGSLLFGRVHDTVPDSAHAVSTAFTMFWQNYVRSREFTNHFGRATASPPYLQDNSYVIARESGRFDLVVFDEYASQQPRPRSVYLGRDFLDDQSVMSWRDRTVSLLRSRDRLEGGRDLDSFERLFASVTQRDLINFAKSVPLQVLVVRPPRALFATTCGIPDPALVAANRFGARAGAAGVLSTNGAGALGATVSLHAISKNIPPPARGDIVHIGMDHGVIESLDPISDSAFVSLDSPHTLPVLTSNGPLRGVSPRACERVTFQRHGVGAVSTVVTGWCPDIPLTLPWTQLRVLTRPCTQPGDSGAALIDMSSNVIGFSIYRTGLNDPIEFSAWIWADSVFQAHELI